MTWIIKTAMGHYYTGDDGDGNPEWSYLQRNAWRFTDRYVAEMTIQCMREKASIVRLKGPPPADRRG